MRTKPNFTVENINKFERKLTKSNNNLLGMTQLQNSYVPNSKANKVPNGDLSQKYDKSTNKMRQSNDKALT